MLIVHYGHSFTEHDKRDALLLIDQMEFVITKRGAAFRNQREMADELTEALEELREMFPGDFFRVEVQQCAQVDDKGNIWWREKRANIMMLSRGLDNFPSAATLSEAMAHVRSWKAAQDAAGEKVRGNG